MDWKVQFTKRAIDVVGASVGLVLTAPLFPVIAAAIKLESPGPVFYSQVRAGLNSDARGESTVPTFRMWKFRSMRTDAEKSGGAQLAQKGDPRITKVGRFLRKTRLDELPQFINVLIGDMSIVGPRPERPELIKHLSAAIPMFEERMRLVRPGITGLAQVSLDYLGRMSDDMPISQHRDALLNPFKLEGAQDSVADDMRTKLLYDMAYAASLENFFTFIKTEAEIIVKTPLVMLGARGR